MARALVPLCLLLIASCADDTRPDPWRRVALSIPVRDDGGTTDLVGLACRPSGDARATVVVINHGSPSNRMRPFKALFPCDDEASAWFLRRGFVVVEALRRGYGATGGDWAESYGACDEADYLDAGLAGARDVDATVRTALALPFARPDGAVVIGQSAGGWATLAYSSLPHPGVAALILMAPGRGGHAGGRGGRELPAGPPGGGGGHVRHDVAGRAAVGVDGERQLFRPRPGGVDAARLRGRGRRRDGAPSRALRRGRPPAVLRGGRFGDLGSGRRVVSRVAGRRRAARLIALAVPARDAPVRASAFPGGSRARPASARFARWSRARIGCRRRRGWPKACSSPASRRPASVGLAPVGWPMLRARADQPDRGRASVAPRCATASLGLVLALDGGVLVATRVPAAHARGPRDRPSRRASAAPGRKRRRARRRRARSRRSR